MPVWTSPGKRFPAAAGVAIDLPDTWTATDVPGAVVAALRPTDDESIVPATLEIAVRRVAPSAAMDEAVTRFQHEMAQLPESQVVREGALEASDGASAYAHEMTYLATGIGTVLQSTRLVLLGGPAATLVVAQATVAGDRVEPDYVEVQKALSGLTVLPA